MTYKNLLLLNIFSGDGFSIQFFDLDVGLKSSRDSEELNEKSDRVADESR